MACRWWRRRWVCKCHVAVDNGNAATQDRDHSDDLMRNARAGACIRHASRHGRTAGTTTWTTTGARREHTIVDVCKSALPHTRKTSQGSLCARAQGSHLCGGQGGVSTHRGERVGARREAAREYVFSFRGILYGSRACGASPPLALTVRAGGGGHSSAAVDALATAGATVSWAAPPLSAAADSAPAAVEHSHRGGTSMRLNGRRAPLSVA